MPVVGAVYPAVKLRVFNHKIRSVKCIEFRGGIMAEMSERPIDDIGADGIAAVDSGLALEGDNRAD